jgi:hypothetical protein
MEIVHIISILRDFILGFISAIMIIGFIHLYSYLFEQYFTYAVFENILITACLSGIPFGIAICAFSKFFKKK